MIKSQLTDLLTLRQLYYIKVFEVNFAPNFIDKYKTIGNQNTHLH